MGINLGETFPNYEVETTKGKMKFYDYFGDSWGMLFSHPADYTPVCTTELGEAVRRSKEFEERNVKLIALSCDTVEDHKEWSKDIVDYAGCAESFPIPYPIIADKKRDIAVKLGMLDPEEKDKAGLPLTCRSVFIIGPDKKLKLAMLYPATTGRNFDEILRVVDSLQLTATKKVATPANWKQGEKCMVIPSVKAEEITSLFPKGVEIRDVPSKKQYMRFTPDPSSQT